MKRHILIPALLLMAVAACNKSVEAPGPQTEKETGAPIHFISNAQGGDTKVTLDGLNLKWAAGDQIAVYSYKDEETSPAAMNLCSLTSGAGEATATFAPTTNLFGEGWVADGVASDDYTFYSWYPTSAAPTGSSETVANVAAAQNEGHLGDYLICWAQGNQTKTRAEVIAGDTPSFAFSPKVALLKVSIKNISENDVTLNSIHVETDSGNIAGDVTLDVKAGTISGGSSSSIEYTPSAQISIAAGATSAEHTIAVLPNEGNLTITAASDDFNLVFTSNGIGSVSEGHCYSVTIYITSSAAKIPLPYDDPDFVNGTYYYGEANCVVMANGSKSATLDVSLYKAGDDHARTTISDRLTVARFAAVIWTEDGIEFSSLSLSNGYSTLNIELSKNVGGNALIGLYDGEGDNAHLLWSFHIWAPKDALPADQLSNGLNGMALALGQVTGDTDTYMYYQWGRKDPLGRAPDYSNAAPSSLFSMTAGVSPYGAVPAKTNTAYGTKTVNDARLNPTVFYKKNSGDWTSRDDNLWKEDSKTIYDPCPKGYRIAPKALWADMTDSDEHISPRRYVYNGLTYTSGGARADGDGSIGGVGSSGYYWSGSVDGTNGVSLNLYPGGVTPSSNKYRAYGYAVRCVQN